jgi:hypothetical protein
MFNSWNMERGRPPRSEAEEVAGWLLSNQNRDLSRDLFIIGHCEAFKREFFLLIIYNITYIYFTIVK